MRDQHIMPRLVLAESGRIKELERFSHYVARQIGFEDTNECPHLISLANDYLKRTKGCEENIFAFFSDDQNAESLYVKLIEEMEQCILAYFSFHWPHATLAISQVLSNDQVDPRRRLRCLVMEATRKQRFERVAKDLKVTRVFTTLVEEMKAIRNDSMVPAAHGNRRPVLLLMGGGMGAGKSTIRDEILKEPFWSAANAVRVEADAFKETDAIYKAISSRGHHNDMLQTAELVHQSSTDAASSLLVTALNEGRDVIMDSTLSWEPFVEQTIAMARNIHQQRYRMGVGHKVADDGTITEIYWEPLEEDETRNQTNSRKPYRIELVGVVCDAHIAVLRGIRRAIITGRAVRVKSQLKSHQRFASAFHRYCNLVDSARLYCTNPMAPKKLIAWKDGNSSLLVEPKEISCLEKVRMLNENANSIHELYPQADATSESNSVWNDMVMSPKRVLVQRELKAAIRINESKS